jgi:hypothetical protein
MYTNQEGPIVMDRPMQNDLNKISTVRLLVNQGAFFII